jgi:hypothetical protein
MIFPTSAIPLASIFPIAVIYLPVSLASCWLALLLALLIESCGSGMPFSCLATDPPTVKHAQQCDLLKKKKEICLPTSTPNPI